MRGAINPLPQYAFMAWYSVKKAQVQLDLTLLYFALLYLTLLMSFSAFCTCDGSHLTCAPCTLMSVNNYLSCKCLIAMCVNYTCLNERLSQDYTDTAFNFYKTAEGIHLSL